MEKTETKKMPAVQAQRIVNLRHVRDINSYYRTQGFEVHAGICLRDVETFGPDGVRKVTRSAEIVSKLGKIMGRGLEALAR